MALELAPSSQAFSFEKAGSRTSALSAMMNKIHAGCANVVHTVSHPIETVHDAREKIAKAQQVSIRREIDAMILEKDQTLAAMFGVPVSQNLIIKSQPEEENRESRYKRQRRLRKERKRAAEQQPTFAEHA